MESTSKAWMFNAFFSLQKKLLIISGHEVRKNSCSSHFNSKQGRLGKVKFLCTPFRFGVPTVDRIYKTIFNSNKKGVGTQARSGNKQNKESQYSITVLQHFLENLQRRRFHSFHRQLIPLFHCSYSYSY